MGPENVAVPEYSGSSKNDYLNTLNNMGIKYTTVEESSATVPIGYVIRTSIDPGYNINVRESQTLTVYVSKGIEQTSSVDSSSKTSSKSSSKTDTKSKSDTESSSVAETEAVSESSTPAETTAVTTSAEETAETESTDTQADSVAEETDTE
jgi:beta-lactam-binding protein with PASTA domain